MNMARMQRSISRLRLAEYEPNVSSCQLVEQTKLHVGRVTVMFDSCPTGHTVTGVAGVPERAVEDRQGVAARSGGVLNVHQTLCILECSQLGHNQT